jgi:Icc-related predicted phosphoesterase
MKILIAANITGSTPAYQRFLAALLRLRADAGVILGDLTGTALVPVVRVGPSEWQVTVDERTVCLGKQTELDAVRDHLEQRGHYWLEMSQEELDKLRNEPALIDLLFKGAVRKRLEEWLERADDALGASEAGLFMSPGPNDWRVIDGLLGNGSRIQACEKQIIPLNGYDMVTVWSSSADDGCVRRESEQQVATQIETLVAESRDARHVILNASAHSRTVHKLVKKLQPMLYVFSDAGAMGGMGGLSHMGATVALNPGVAASDDGTSALRAAVVELHQGEVKDCAHICI